MVLLPLIDKTKLGFWQRPLLFSISRKKRFGTVKFTNKNICVFRNKNALHYYLEDIEFLKINGDLFLEFNPLNFPDISNEHKIIHSGKTTFTISVKNKKVEINFLITTIQEFNELAKILKSWYCSKQFKIREYDKSEGRMLLLNPYYSYESIQRVKKEIGIESLYE